MEILTPSEPMLPLKRVSGERIVSRGVRAVLSLMTAEWLQMTAKGDLKRRAVETVMERKPVTRRVFRDARGQGCGLNRAKS